MSVGIGEAWRLAGIRSWGTIEHLGFWGAFLWFLVPFLRILLFILHFCAPDVLLLVVLVVVAIAFCAICKPFDLH